MLNTLHMGPSAWTNPIRNHDQWWYIVIPIYIYRYMIYIYISIGRTCLVAPILSLIRMRSVCIQLNTNVTRGLVKRAQLLWHMHNFCETCTTAGKRAQHNISEMCTYGILEKTGWGRWNTLYPYIYIPLYIYHYIYTTIYIPLYIYTTLYISLYTYINMVTYIYVGWYIDMHAYGDVYIYMVIYGDIRC